MPRVRISVFVEDKNGDDEESWITKVVEFDSGNTIIEANSKKLKSGVGQNWSDGDALVEQIILEARRLFVQDYFRPTGLPSRTMLESMVAAEKVMLRQSDSPRPAPQPQPTMLRPNYQARTENVPPQYNPPATKIPPGLSPEQFAMIQQLDQRIPKVDQSVDIAALTGAPPIILAPNSENPE